jgi:hypothetical protein
MQGFDLSNLGALIETRSPSSIADDIHAALKAWNISWADQRTIGGDLRAISSALSDSDWAALNPLNTAPMLGRFTWAHPMARELVQVMKIFGMTCKQFREFAGRLYAISANITPKAWDEWKPDINPATSIPGLVRPN